MPSSSYSSSSTASSAGAAAGGSGGAGGRGGRWGGGASSPEMLVLPRRVCIMRLKSLEDTCQSPGPSMRGGASGMSNRHQQCRFPQSSSRMRRRNTGLGSCGRAGRTRGGGGSKTLACGCSHAGSAGGVRGGGREGRTAGGGRPARRPQLGPKVHLSVLLARFPQGNGGATRSSLGRWLRAGSGGGAGKGGGVDLRLGGRCAGVVGAVVEMPLRRLLA